jgi:hypothetical protein
MKGGLLAADSLVVYFYSTSLLLKRQSFVNPEGNPSQASRQKNNQQNDADMERHLCRKTDRKSP